MYVDFDSLPDTSRVWIYQADREFNDEELELLEKKLRDFTDNWTKHSKPLKASYQIRYRCFIVLSVDESFRPVSGCSIDASTSFIKSLEAEFGVKLIDRMLTAFKTGEGIQIVNLSEFKELARSKKIDKETPVFNNLINDKSELTSRWEIKAEDSWHSRFLN